MRNEDERFEADLRAALAPEPASLALRQRVLAQAVQENRAPKGVLATRSLPGKETTAFLKLDISTSPSIAFFEQSPAPHPCRAGSLSIASILYPSGSRTKQA